MILRLSSSVRDACHALTEAPNYERHPLPLRGLLGAQVHAAFSAERADVSPEVDIRGQYVSRDGSRLSLHGRADLTEMVEGRMRLTEFKTVLLPPGELSLQDELPPERYALQAKLYAYLLSTSDAPSGGAREDVDCELVLHNLADGERRSWPVAWSRLDVETALERYLELRRQELAEAAVECARRKRLAKRLAWPYARYRLGQRELARSVRQVLYEGGDILVQAPPGSGKTMGILFPALKHALTQGRQLFFATAKGGGRGAVRRAIERLLVVCEELRILFLSPRVELCPEGSLTCSTCQHYQRRYQPDNPADVHIPAGLLRPGLTLAGDLIRAGEAAGVCPLELAQAFIRRVDVVVGDYNFVFDPRARLREFRGEEPLYWTLLVDEAHNLFDRARQSFATRLDLAAIERCRTMLTGELWRHPEATAATELTAALDGIARLIEDSLEILPTQGVVPIEAEAEKWERGMRRLGLATACFIAQTFSRLDTDVETELLRTFRSVQMICDRLGLDREAFPFYGERSPGAVGVACLDPQEPLKQIVSRFAAVISFSATFSPLSFHRDALGFGARPAALLEAEDPFPQERRRIVIAQGIDTRLRARLGEAARIARTIDRFIRLKAGGYLAVFPSFEFIETVEPRLDRGFGVDILLQRPGMEREDRERLRQALNRRGVTTLALVAAGGQFTEAEDYPGDSCVGVIIVGPCLPPPDPWREALRQYWERRGEDGALAAYVIPGIRKVIQAAGRLIRSRKDRGVILLLDDRFLRSPFFDLLPAKWRTDLTACGSDWLGSVASFWCDAELVKA